MQSSHTEGLPNVLLEASLREFPWSPPKLVARANYSIKVRYGTLVPRGDSGQLAAAVVRLISQPERRGPAIASWTRVDC